MVICLARFSLVLKWREIFEPVTWRSNCTSLSSLETQVIPCYHSISCFFQVGSQLVQPLLAMITEMNRRQTELFRLLRKKDEEIMDYKESGVRLSRSILNY